MRNKDSCSFWSSSCRLKVALVLIALLSCNLKGGEKQKIENEDEGRGRARTDLRYWPQWRGPLATGVAPLANPPVHWSETNNVRWKLLLPGKGHLLLFLGN